MARTGDRASTIPPAAAGAPAREPGALAAAIDAARRRAAGENSDQDDATRIPQDDEDDEDDASDREEASAGSPVAAARGRERGRVAAILGSPAASGNQSFAYYLAFATPLSRHDAIAMLRSSAPAPAPAAAAGGARPRLADRMAGDAAVRGVGMDVSRADPGSAARIAQQIVAAGDKARSRDR